VANDRHEQVLDVYLGMLEGGSDLLGGFDDRPGIMGVAGDIHMTELLLYDYD
jgi:hypothetical protein